MSQGHYQPLVPARDKPLLKRELGTEMVRYTLVLFFMENALYLTMSQGMLYLKDPLVPARDKPFLKRELGTEMVRYTLVLFVMENALYLTMSQGHYQPLVPARDKPLLKRELGTEMVVILWLCL